MNPFKPNSCSNNELFYVCRTYAMLKPEVIDQMGKILTFIEDKGFRFNKIMLTKISANRAAEFYREHQGRAFYEYARSPLLFVFLNIFIIYCLLFPQKTCKLHFVWSCARHGTVSAVSY